MKPLQLLIKPASSACNLHCSYCFYHDIGSNRTQANRGLMSLDTFKILARKALASTDSFCTFSFQGGEPALAGLNFFRSAVEIIHQYNEKNIPVYYTFQTNGTLITEEWARFFAEHHFLVGVSLDGPPEIHNKHRTDSSHRHTYADVLTGIENLRKNGVEFNILAVITNNSVPHAARIYDFFRKKHFTYLQFIPCIAPLYSCNEKAPLSPQAYGDFLCAIFDRWYEELLAGQYISIRQFDNYMLILQGRPPESCDMGGLCAVQHVVESDGSVYPCDFFSLDEYLLGNIITDSFEHFAEKRSTLRFIEESQIHTPHCLRCRYYVLCRGGCKRHRIMTADTTLQTNYFCESFIRFFDHCAQRLLHAAKIINSAHKAT